MHLARLRSDASGGPQLTVCQGLYPPEGWRVGKRTGVPQNEGGHEDGESTLSSRNTGHGSARKDRCRGMRGSPGGWGWGRGGMPSVTAVGWAWSFQADVKQRFPKTEQQLEGLDESLTWHLSVQHALGGGYLAASI